MTFAPFTPARLAERLVERGLDPAEQRAKASLYEAALSAGDALGGGRPEHAWWVPGRLEVFGKHTDYAGGRTLIAAVPRGFAFVAAAGADDRIHVLDARTGERLTLEAGERALHGWRRYVDVVARRLARNFPGAWRGASIAFKSDLPRASGMSSSSALVVGVASALARVWNLRERDEWRRNINGRADLASYLASLENGQTFGTLAGDAGVGTHGGSEDHAAMLLGRPGHVSAWSFVPMRHLGDARVPDAWRFVIASSGVTSEKTGSAREAYNRLSAGAEVLLGLANAEAPGSGSLAAAVAGEGAAERLRNAIRRGDVPGWSAQALERRLAHFVAEDAAVAAALDAFRREDPAALGTLSAASQADAAALLGNQVPETITLVESARACGAFAACSFGAGFGGSAWALVGSGEAHQFAAMWLKDYQGRCRSTGAVAFAARPGPPLIELTDPNQGPG